MGKNKKGKKQGQETVEEVKSEDIQPTQIDQELNDQEEQFVDDAVLIQPNSHQQKIIEEILKDDVEEEEQQNKNQSSKDKQDETSTEKQVADDNLIDIIDENNIDKSIHNEIPVVTQTPQQQQQHEDQIIVSQNVESKGGNHNNSKNVNQPESEVNEQNVQTTGNNVTNQQEQQDNLGSQVGQQTSVQDNQSVEQLAQQEVRFTVDIFDQAKNGFLLPWAYAIENNLISALEYDNEGYHLIHRAALYNQLDIVHQLIHNHGVPVDLVEKNVSQTPLILACLYGHMKLVKYLIQEQHANVNAIDNNSFSPLINSVMNRYTILAIYLLSKGADVNVLDQENCNLAHRAAFNNDVPMLQIINAVAREQFEEQDRYKLAPVGRAITNDSHQAFQYLQRTRPIPVPNKNFNNLPNKCMANLINTEFKKQNIKCFTKEWVIDCYKQRPKDMCIFMYAIMIGTLYYHFVLQTGILYHKSTNHYYFCNVVHALTAFLMTYIFIFALKMECPSLNLKLAQNGGQTNRNFYKYDISKVNFKYLDRLFGYSQNGVNTQSSEDIEIEEQHSQQKTEQIHPCKRSISRMNLFDYVAILFQNEKFSELKKLNERNVCYECLAIKEERSHHSNKFGFCIKNVSHYSEIFDKLIIKGNNHNQYYLIISLQWVLLILFFIANYLYCTTNYSFEGMAIFTFVEIPFIYYFDSNWKFFGIYLFACALFYLASIYFFIETFCLIQNLTRFEVFYPNRCDYFYPNSNIQEYASMRSRMGVQGSASQYFRYYSNPFSKSKNNSRQ